MSDWAMKRFWKEVSICETSEGYCVLLDGRGVKTPAKATLAVPTRAMAEAIAAEWEAIEKEIDPNVMPFTRSANAAIDKVSIQHAEVADMLAAYGDADLLCYRAEEPAELVARQSQQWDPLLQWASTDLAVELNARSGVMHVAQDPKALDKLRSMTHELNPFELAAFHDLVSLSGSLILGFAAIHEKKGIVDLWLTSRLDEIWQEEQWGFDEEAHAASEVKKAAFLHAKWFFDASRNI